MSTISLLKRKVEGTLAQIVEYQQTNGVDENIEYIITDAPEFSITNEQMELALTSQKDFYEENAVYICIDNGVYKENTFYKYTLTEWIEINMSSNPDNLTINTNASGKLQAVALTDGSSIKDYASIATIDDLPTITIIE